VKAVILRGAGGCFCAGADLKNMEQSISDRPRPGEKDPVALDHHSPVLHLIQLIRDEAHRFAVTFHRKRRQMRDRSTELLEIPGVGASTTRRLLEHFGSVQAVKQADPAALSAVVTRTQAEAIKNHFRR